MGLFRAFSERFVIFRQYRTERTNKRLLSFSQNILAIQIGPKTPKWDKSGRVACWRDYLISPFPQTLSKPPPCPRRATFRLLIENFVFCCFFVLFIGKSLSQPQESREASEERMGKEEEGKRQLNFFRFFARRSDNTRNEFRKTSPHVPTRPRMRDG